MPPGLLSYGLTDPESFLSTKVQPVCQHISACMLRATACLQHFPLHYQAVQLVHTMTCITNPIPKTVDHKISNMKKCLQHSMDLLKAFHTINCALLGDSATQPYPWLVGFTLALVIMRQCRDCTFLAFFNNRFIDSVFLMALCCLKGWTL